MVKKEAGSHRFKCGVCGELIPGGGIYFLLVGIWVDPNAGEGEPVQGKEFRAHQRCWEKTPGNGGEADVS